MSWNQEQIDSTLRSVVERSITDAAFRALAIKEPKSAIARITNEPVPADIKVQFIDNNGFDVTVVLPDPVKAQDANAVSDEELAGVAGGTFGPPVDTIVCATYLCTIKNATPFNPLYTKKPNSPTLCP